ncbi:hypothetical protein ES703_67153 [subsurface metagenome]
MKPSTHSLVHSANVNFPIEMPTVLRMYRLNNDSASRYDSTV